MGVSYSTEARAEAKARKEKLVTIEAGGFCFQGSVPKDVFNKIAEQAFALSKEMNGRPAPEKPPEPAAAPVPEQPAAPAPDAVAKAPKPTKAAA